MGFSASGRCDTKKGERSVNDEDLDTLIKNLDKTIEPGYGIHPIEGKNILRNAIEKAEKKAHNAGWGGICFSLYKKGDA